MTTNSNLQKIVKTSQSNSSMAGEHNLLEHENIRMFGETVSKVTTKNNNLRSRSPLKPANLGTLQTNNIIDLVWEERADVMTSIENKIVFFRIFRIIDRFNKVDWIIVLSKSRECCAESSEIYRIKCKISSFLIIKRKSDESNFYY